VLDTEQYVALSTSGVYIHFDIGRPWKRMSATVRWAPSDHLIL
jgi:hypothetical protein